jgi:hypothetical protein
MEAEEFFSEVDWEAVKSGLEHRVPGFEAEKMFREENQVIFGNIDGVPANFEFWVVGGYPGAHHATEGYLEVPKSENLEEELRDLVKPGRVCDDFEYQPDEGRYSIDCFSRQNVAPGEEVTGEVDIPKDLADITVTVNFPEAPMEEKLIDASLKAKEKIDDELDSIRGAI